MAKKQEVRHGKGCGDRTSGFQPGNTESLFYVDKTKFIKEWWENGDAVTLITRPRRFGKTLNMSMLEQFFSLDYAGRGDLFEGLSIWQEKLPDCGESSVVQKVLPREDFCQGRTC